jgi:LuxR family maltose regulon positive regulatory protein
LVKPVEASNRWGTAIEIFALQSLALQALGDSDHAIALMEKALTLAQPEEYMRTFIDLGPQVKILLQGIISADGKMKAYAQMLLGIYQEAETFPPSGKPQILVEPLSERELEVLQLMGQGLSGPEIADRLYVSLNTVKTHNKKIYSKLGVNRRFDAIQRAKELDLI